MATEDLAQQKDAIHQADLKALAGLRTAIERRTTEATSDTLWHLAVALKNVVEAEQIVLAKMTPAEP